MKKVSILALMAVHMAAFTAKAETFGVYEKRDEPSVKSIGDAIDKIGTAFEEYKKTNDQRIEAIKAGNSTADYDAKLAKMDSAIDQLSEVKAKLEKVEIKLARPGVFGDKQDRESPEAVEYKNALLDWVRSPTDQARMQKAAQAQKGTGL